MLFTLRIIQLIVWSKNGECVSELVHVHKQFSATPQQAAFFKHLSFSYNYY